MRTLRGAGAALAVALFACASPRPSNHVRTTDASRADAIAADSQPPLGTIVDARSPVDGIALDGADASIGETPDAPVTSGLETCSNGLDDDANGAVDDGCDCVVGAELSCFRGSAEDRGRGQCADGTMTCGGLGLEFGAWGECLGSVLPSGEICDAAHVDEDCDGTANEGCECSEGDPDQPCGMSVGACVAGAQRCVDSRWADCDGALGPTAETCNGADDDCDGAIDEDLVRSCGVGTGACTVGMERCVAGVFGVCEGETRPVPEICNAIDDDCDGLVDEELARSCGSDVGACVIGTETCSAGEWATLCAGETRPSEERCDGVIDEDCDGDVDEGCSCAAGDLRTCGSDVGACEPGTQRCFASGEWGDCEGATHPAIERCNGADDDCDGTTDEGCDCITGATRACGTETGECVAGTERCDAAGRWGVCTGQTGPRTETCNALDDDCDGMIDELLVRRCGTDVGACVAGTQSCSAGAWSMTCAGEVIPRSEVCEGIVDDDCDGVIDDGCACVSGATRPCGTDVGECVAGSERCSAAGAWSTCSGARGPTGETCNGRDDDCDMTTDEGEVCLPPLVSCPENRDTFVGDVELLAGSASDPDGGPVSGAWTLATRPFGSTAALSSVALNASFAPDLPGTYRARLCVADNEGARSCCETEITARARCVSPARPAAAVCGTSWDRRPIVHVPPLPAGLVYELFAADDAVPFAVVSLEGQNYVRPPAALSPGGPPPGVTTPISVRACEVGDRACCSESTTVTAALVESCSTPRAPTATDLALSEFVIDGVGACPGPTCEAGEAIEITNLSNCPIALEGHHFFYCNGPCSTGSYRHMNFGADDVIPPRGVYVVIREAAASTCANPFFGPDDPHLFGLRISRLVMQGPNLANGWFTNSGGGRFRIATGAYSSPTGGTTLLSFAYTGSPGGCGSAGYDAIDQCGEFTPASMIPSLMTNQLGRLWHPCDAIGDPVPASCR